MIFPTFPTFPHLKNGSGKPPEILPHHHPIPFTGGGGGEVVSGAGKSTTFFPTTCKSVRHEDDKMKNEINFTAPPPVGTVVEFGPGRWITLVAVEPYTRIDGIASHILRWVSSGGLPCSSGLVAKGVQFPPKWKRYGVPA